MNDLEPDSRVAAHLFAVLDLVLPQLIAADLDFKEQHAACDDEIRDAWLDWPVHSVMRVQHPEAAPVAIVSGLPLKLVVGQEPSSLPGGARADNAGRLPLPRYHFPPACRITERSD